MIKFNKVIEINKPMGEYNEFILPSLVLEYFINKAKNHWVMNFCICRSSMSCQDYPVDLGCLFLGDAVLDINPKLGRLVSKEGLHKTYTEVIQSILSS